MQRIHIVGAPRSGTTLLLESMIAGFVFDVFARSETGVLVPPPAQARTTCSKRPRDIVLAARLLALDPDQWFVHVVRDPRDVVVSVHALATDRYWTSLWYWRRAYGVARALATHPRFVEVRYEELVRDPDGVQRTLARRMPFLEWRAPFSRFHEIARPSRQSVQAMGTLRPIDARGIGAWRRHLPRLAGQVAIHGSPARELIELGYEVDAEWERELEGIEPDLHPGFWPERPTAERLARDEAKDLEALRRYAAARGLPF